MEQVNLPTETAQVPGEEAYEPQREDMSHSKRKTLNIRFAEATQSSQKSSQCSSTYKEALSQPASTLTHRQRLQWLQQRRTEGLWAQCDSCSRWRYLPHVLDSHELPAKWYCNMNPDKKYADCSIPEAHLHVKEEEDLIHGEYSAGSVVWARLPGWPWWPAMVDDCPDTEQYYWLDGFSDIPTYYNVVFFDAFDCTRAWITPENLQPYESNKNKSYMKKDKKYKKRLEAAQIQADDANALPLKNRLAKYSFIARYPGAINGPKKFKRNELKKFQNQLKRKYNIEFESDESETESEDDEASKIEQVKRGNVILLGTPKKPKQNKIVAKDKKKAEITNKKNKFQDSLLGNVDTQNEADTQNDSDSINNGSEIKDSPKKIEVPETIVKENDEVVNENQNEKAVNCLFKQPNSMAVQIGSTAESLVVEGSFDNDTSKTYVPDSESESESVGQETIAKIQKRAASPGSDDFDF